MGKKKKSSRNRRILWIEDQTRTVEPLAYLLFKQGLSVDLVGRIRAACNSLELHRYDLIILDCMLPPTSVDEHPNEVGVNFMKKLRSGKISGGSHKNVPVIVLTAVGDIDILHRLQKQKITKLLRKPVVFDEIYKTILEVIAED